MSENSQENKCGIIMPISAIDGCSEGHWLEVLAIISDSIKSAGFVGDVVSNGDDSGIIQKRIIENLYDNPIVVCDVSGKNPNVMFELGMRLAFDKPTIIIKDDRTSYSFDTSAIEHLEYPRDLRFLKIVEFKAKLAEKIRATVKKAAEDPNYTTFLKHFGEFKVAKIEKKEVPGLEILVDEMRLVKDTVRRMERLQNNKENPDSGNLHFITNRLYAFDYRSLKIPRHVLENLVKTVETHPLCESVRTSDNEDGTFNMEIKVNSPAAKEDIIRYVNTAIGGESK